MAEKNGGSVNHTVTPRPSIATTAPNNRGSKATAGTINPKRDRRKLHATASRRVSSKVDTTRTMPPLFSQGGEGESRLPRGTVGMHVCVRTLGSGALALTASASRVTVK